MKINFKAIENTLMECWSKKSSSQYTPENPALGQCSVTSLVIQDIFGGEIVKTEILGEWHFYNRIDNQYLDFTHSQFAKSILYVNFLSNRKEAMQETDEKKYQHLKEKLTQRIDQKNN